MTSFNLNYPLKGPNSKYDNVGSSVQSLSHVQLFVTLWTATCQPPCPSPTPRVYPNSCPLSWWCHPTISSSVVPFSCPQSFPASGSFPMSHFFVSDGQGIGVSGSASVLPMNAQDWSFRMDWLDLLAVQETPKSLLQHHSSKVLTFLYSPTLTSIHEYRKNHSFD